MVYNWIYTTSNDNIYILILIIIILFFIIIDFGLWKKKSDRFYDVQNDDTTIPTEYERRVYDNHMNPNFYISKEVEIRRNAWSQLDGDEESLLNTNGSK